MTPNTSGIGNSSPTTSQSFKNLGNNGPLKGSTKVTQQKVSPVLSIASYYSHAIQNPPTVDKEKLKPPEEIVAKNEKLLNKGKISTLAARLAQESFFTREVMSQCTFHGVGTLPALPSEQVKEMKAFLKSIIMPKLTNSLPEFEMIYKSCVEAVGQRCKGLRNQQAAGQPLD